MQLTIQSLIPLPLREKISARRSGIWNTELHFQAPEYIFIQAPSGTGKTTLIHSLYGLRKDFSGTIAWDEVSMSNKNAEQIADLRASNLSVIFQDMRLFPELSAWENLEVKRSLSNTVSEQEITEWMERLGVGDKKNALGSTLSYGEQQRIAIIRALLQPFQWILMDEPFSHLDKKNTELAAALILEVVQRNNAGLLLADLDENAFFPYQKTLFL
jgi:ABC-type lipoprotein export system ATPase subunit